MVDHEFSRRNLTRAAVSALGMAFGVGPIIFATFSLFMLPLAQEFGWSRGQIAFALTISSSSAALASPFMGRLTDRIGTRRVLLAGIVIFAGANAVLSLVGKSLTMFYATHVLIGLSATACGYVPYSKLLAGTFETRRGLGLGAALGIGVGVGGALMVQAAHFLISTVGWRDARLALAGLILMIPFPAVLFLLRETARNPRPTEDAPELRFGVAAKVARRDPLFWKLIAMIFFGTTALAGVAVHIVALLIDRGLSPVSAAGIFSTLALANVVGHVVVGALLDRIPSPKVGVGVYLCALAGLFLVADGVGLGWVWLGAVLLGLGFGAEVSLAAYWASRYWGLRAFGEVYGALSCAASAGSAIGPLIMGATSDHFGLYHPALLGFQFVIATCLILNLTLKPYVFPVSAGDEQGRRRRHVKSDKLPVHYPTL